MAARAPLLVMTEHAIDPLLAAVERAPFVPMTDEEAALLAEVEGRSVRWIPTDQLLSTLNDTPQ